MRVEKLGDIELRCQDCMEYMRGLDDGAFDLAIVDPPYGLPKDSTHGRGKLKHRILNAGHIQDWDVAPSKEYFDELFRVSKHQIIWGGNYFDLPPTRGIICWDKCQPWENFSQWEMAWTSFDTPASLFRFDNRTRDKIHPTQKPVDYIVGSCISTPRVIGRYSIRILVAVVLLSLVIWRDTSW